jgi:hypothetical protein
VAVAVAYLYLIVLATLVGAQIAMARLYGWVGLAVATGAAMVLAAGVTALYFFWVDARYAGEWLREAKADKRLASVFFLLIPTLTALVGAVLSAAFVKTEQ